GPLNSSGPGLPSLRAAVELVQPHRHRWYKARMDKDAFLSRYRELLHALAQAPRDVPTWVALARHIDGRELNFEECLASTEELQAIDEDKLVPWSKYIWEHVVELAPEHLEALELVVEHHAEVLDDPDGAAPILASLLAV